MQPAASAFSACQLQIKIQESFQGMGWKHIFHLFLLKMDYQIKGNCSITAAERNASHLIELGFFISVISVFVFWQLPSVCPGPALLISYSDWERGFIPATVSHLLSLSFALCLSPFLTCSLTQTIVMEIIRGAKPQTKERALTHTWAKKNRIVV